MPMRQRLMGLMLALCCASPGLRAEPAALPDGVAWHTGDVDAAFAQARRENKPLFLYWGAVWCPPCNQVKATIFSRRDFIDRSRLFVPVYVDGDAPAAQKLASRFKVSAYPTMVLFRPDGSEVTRLPGEVDGDRYMQVLSRGVSGGRSVKTLLLQAERGKAAGLSAADWRLLAFYSWDTDEQSLLPRQDMAATLWTLAQRSAAAAPDASARLALKAALMAAHDRSQKNTPEKIGVLQRVMDILGDPALARAAFAEVTYAAERVPGWLTAPDDPARQRLLQRWDAALLHLAADAGLSRLDRLAATGARVALARTAVGAAATLPMPLQTQVRAVTLRAVRDATDRYEREAVVTAAAQTLTDAGLIDESDRLLQAELAISATPYYHMLGLAGNARKRGDAAAALGWYRKAHEAAKGPATRLQWGALHVRALIDLSPDDAARIDATAQSVLDELAPRPDSFHGRNRSALERLSARLLQWNADGRHEAVLQRLRERRDRLCGGLPADAPEREDCRRFLAPAANAAA